jgi:hypothetical protein
MKVIAALLLLWISAAAAAPQQPASIQGIVTDAITGQPIAKASIELRGLGNSPFPLPQQSGVDATAPGFPGLTSERGQFVLRNIPPGQYTLTASHTGYVHGEYGQHGPNGKAFVLTVGSGQQLSGIRLVMLANGAISGHAYDGKGLPLAYVQMQARRIGYPDGLRMLTVTSSTVTDDLGAYRLYGLPPGQYILSAETYTNNVGITPVAASQTPPVPGVVMFASAHGPMLTDADPANQNRRRDPGVVVYYPNVLDDRDATIIEIRPGADFTNTDVTLGNVRATTATESVRATITTDPAGGNGSAEIIFITKGTLATRTRLLPPANNNSAQSFNLNLSLPSGSYTAVAIQRDPAGTPAWTALVNFDIGTSPVNINLPLQPTQTISGRVLVEGQAAGINADLSKLRIAFRRTPLALFLPAIPEAAVKSDGSFTVQGFLEGDYILSLSGFQDGLQAAYLKSVSISNVNIDGTRIHVETRPEPLTLELRIAANGGQLSGSPVTSSSEKLSNVTVLLAPVNLERRELYRTEVSDPMGSYNFEQLPPGDYKLYAWEDIEPNAWFSPTFAQRMQDQGTLVHVAEGSRQQVDVPAIPLR